MNPTPPTPPFRFRPSEHRATPLWPTMLRATGLGLRPERVIVAFFAALLVSGLVRLPIPWESWQSLRSMWLASNLRLDPVMWIRSGEGPLAERASWLELAATFLSAHVWSLLAVGVPILAVLVVASAIIARMTAVEFGLTTVLSTRAAAGLVKARLVSLAAAFGIPILLTAITLLVFAAGGAVLLAFPGLDLLGAALYCLAVFGSILLSVLLAAFVLGAPMLPAAVVCEGTGSGEHGRGDAIDALQRVLAYVLNAPLRFALFAAISLAQLALVAWVAGLIASAATTIARLACTLWLSQDRAAALAIGGNGATGLASSVMAFWEWLPSVLASACTLAVFASGSTLVYLLLRRVCDGQHEREVWTASQAPPPPPESGESQSGPDDDE